ncbi:hypothetical protein SDJN02_05665, partial [Cucurbita argyrosperma subsp. argyrosperma]
MEVLHLTEDEKFMSAGLIIAINPLRYDLFKEGWRSSIPTELLYYMLTIWGPYITGVLLNNPEFAFQMQNHPTSILPSTSASLTSFYLYAMILVR